ncbi:NeuD/PglB/VioB family sugar acetyltransferase [Nonlabens ulvanivorans]|uniref:Sugar O-acyltransferase (Sialic acid O-acetyltransferase NeuD family) n=1 Tax=Nonlabens ulvanivorans TaxID=906888 RepID=A0A084JXS3_NONUL|nr:NeuD/PglB/VioB family sugar acetyltransferase [Nonlabens ulvanivorans]KEZ93757.1 hypothetical protein IL45_06025 [Nonlabens ulvanivorans]PRX14354.1 sugar O-acyltransferase (sialic acid O-acetyltransferase NeuD family) [Nonlabens ulvanivorans]
MVIAGSQGHAHEVFEILKLNGFKNEDIAFFDDVNSIQNVQLPDLCKHLKSINELTSWMNSTNDNSYVYGLGGLNAKVIIENKFSDIGALLKQVIAPSSIIGEDKITLGIGIQIMSQACITTHVTIGDHCLINAGSRLLHDVVIGNNCDIAPAALILGRATIGNNCFIGASATILPDITIGDNATIGAGAVVTENIPANAVAVGVPARVIKYK